MRMTRIHGSLLVGVTVLGVAGILISRGFRPSPGSPPQTDAKASKSQAYPPPNESPKTSRRTPGISKPVLPVLPAPVESPHPPNSAQHQEWIATRVAELSDLAWFDDPQSLHRILAELRNPQPEIQAASLAATVAFGSRDAIPYLEALAAQSRDPKQQQDLSEAAAFLKLPTLLDRAASPSAPQPETHPNP